jgi:hypothetical protein
MELKMTIVKSLAIIALLVGGTSLAMAQNGPSPGGEPPVAGGAGGNSAATGKHLRPFHHPFLHRRVYMQAAPSSSHKMAPSSHNHKHIKMNPAPSTTKQ